jgi:predicted nucleotidyltransferase
MSTSAHDVTVIEAPPPCSLDALAQRAVLVLRAAGVRRAVVFGSWARGEADGFSDLDLVVVMDTDLPRVERGRELLAQLDEALPVVVDLLVYTPAEFAAGTARGFGVFDALASDGVEILA